MTAPTKAQIEACADRPSIRPVCLANIPNALRDLDQWVLWSYEKAHGRDGWTKVPFRLELVGPVGRKRPFRYPASSTDPDTWTDYESVAGSIAVNEASGRVGAGLVLCANGIVCIDLDDCRNRDTGELTAESLDLVRRLDSYTEVSPSGTGIKIFVLATKPGERCKHTSRKIELYDRARFVAITGDRLPGTRPDLQPRQVEIDALYAELFPVLAAPTGCTVPVGPASTPFRPTDLSDAAILDRATNAANGFKFDSLWRGDTSHHNHDKSAADAALASMLAFWTQDAAQISRLMWASGLVRDKWRDRKGYLDTTVARALEGCRAHYGDSRNSWGDALAAELAGLVGATVTEEGDDTKPAVAGASTPRPWTMAPDALADLERFRVERGQPGYPDYWQEENIAAARCRESRRDQERHHCPHCRKIVLRHRATGEPWVFDLRCERRLVCEGCRRYLDDRETINGDLRFRQAVAAGDTLHVVRCTFAAWPSLHKAIRRQHHQYMRIIDGDGFTVITTAELRDGSCLPDAAAALALLTALLSVYFGAGRPVSTSRGWVLPRDDDGKGDFERLGKGNDSLTPEFLDQAAEDVQARAVPIIPRTGPKRILRMTRFVRPGGWPEDVRDRLGSHLAAGDILPRMTVFEDFGPPAHGDDGSALMDDLALV